MLADALGRPLRFIVTPGQAGDITHAPALLEGQTGGAVLAEKPMTAMLCGRLSLAWGCPVQAQSQGLVPP